jgi:transcriptional regulator with XRE-family HTH domain
MRINPHALVVVRERTGLKQAQLAARADVSPGYLSKMESGKAPGTPDVIARIAAALEVPLAAIALSSPDVGAA